MSLLSALVLSHNTLAEILSLCKNVPGAYEERVSSNLEDTEECQTD